MKKPYTILQVDHKVPIKRQAIFIWCNKRIKYVIRNLGQNQTNFTGIAVSLKNTLKYKQQSHNFAYDNEHLTSFTSGIWEKSSTISKNFMYETLHSICPFEN